MRQLDAQPEASTSYQQDHPSLGVSRRVLQPPSPARQRLAIKEVKALCLEALLLMSTKQPCSTQSTACQGPQVSMLSCTAGTSDQPMPTIS